MAGGGVTTGRSQTHSPVKETLLVESDDQSVNATGGAISHVFTFPPFVFDVFAPSLSGSLHIAVRMRLHQSFTTEE